MAIHFLKKIITTIIFVSFLPNLTNAQKGVKLNVGFFSLPFNASTQVISNGKDLAKIKTPFGMGLYLNYDITNKFGVMTGIEYTSFKTNFFNQWDKNIQNFGIPIMVRYQVFENMKKNLSISLQTGIVLERDFPLREYWYSYQNTDQGKLNTYVAIENYLANTSNALKFYSFSLKGGINITKNYDKIGTFNLFCNYNFYKKNATVLDLNISKNVESGFETTNFPIENTSAKISNLGLQIGVGYTFGKIVKNR
jgi:hypothetical protein